MRVREGLPWYLHGTVCVRIGRAGGSREVGREVGRGYEGARVLLAARARACMASRAERG